MPSMSTEMKIRTVMAAQGIARLPRGVRGAWHAPLVRVPLAVLLACALAACTGPTTTVSRTRTVTRTKTVTAQPTPLSPNLTPAARHTAVVTRVVDGDTAYVRYHGRDVDVRFIGVDTPETVAPGQPVECYGPEASAFTTKQLTGTSVRLEFDVDRIDPYGRTLAYIWLAGTLFNETLVRDGFATVATYPPDTKYVQRFQSAQRRAKAAGRGLWGAC
jgi:micrococcal nuclease